MSPYYSPPGTVTAASVTSTASGDVSATNVDAAIAELASEKATTGSVTTVATDLSNHLADTSDAHDASAISVDSTNLVGTGTDVQTVLGELDDAITYTVAETGDLCHSLKTSKSGWLACDGTAVSRTTYADLFTLLSTSFGVGDGSTTFNLPDYRGRALYGLGTHADVNAVTDNDGVAVGSRSPNHTHTGPSHSHTGASLVVAADNAYTATQSGTGVNRANGTHTHSISGSTGLSGTAATGSANPGYGVARIFIKY